MFLNAAGAEKEVEVATLDVTNTVEDKRNAGLLGWIRSMFTNSDEISFDQISEGLRALLPENAYPREVFQRYFVWCDYKADKLYQQDYAVDSEGSVALIGQAVEVRRKVEYEPITNHERVDPVKDKILAALNAAGIQSAGLDDAQLLTAYNALQVKPHTDALTAANSKFAALELAANAAADAELTALATSLAVNTSLTADDFKAMGLARCKELANTAKAAPVVTDNAGAVADEFEGYDINKL